MPPQVLLAAKLIALFLLAHYLARYGTRDVVRLGSLSPELGLLPAVLRTAAQCVAVAAAVLLICNRWVRWTSIVLGLCATLEFALHRADSSELFLGVLLFLAGLNHNARELLLLRYTVVAAYVFGGLSWLSGVGSAPLLDALAGRLPVDGIAASETYRALKVALPPGLPAQITDWTMAVICICIAAGLLTRRFYPAAVWAAIALHCARCFLTAPVEAISYAALSCLLVFGAWPHEPLAVIYDGDCGFCNKTREWISKADPDGLYDWLPFQSGAGERHGISRKALEAKVHVVAGRRIYKGYRAFRAMALYNPVTWLTAALLLAAVGIGAPRIRDGAFLALAILLSPLLYPVGEAAYAWVSRNRHRLPPRTCKAPQ
jgi:predicted DCC family thiol-disulfide oxidoreductase YuxK